MEKIGISREDLLKELKADYHETRKALAEQVKLGAADALVSSTVHARLEAIKAKINELEAEAKEGLDD